MKRRSSRDLTARAGFGVDFGQRLLKAILVEESFEGIVVRAAVASSVPPGCFEGDVISDRRRICALLKSLCRSQGISPKRGGFSVPTSSLSLRWIEIPPVHPDDLDNVARFQAQRYFQVQPDKTYQTLVPLGPASGVGPGESDTLPYLLICAPRSVIESRAAVMEGAGIEPVCADVEPFCVLRALHSLFTRGGVFWRNQSLTFVEMGAHSTQMYVVKDMVLRFVRAIPFGGNSIARTVAQTRGCTEDEASELIESASSALDATGELRVGSEGERSGYDVQPVLEPMVREIHRLLTYYRSLYPERSYAGILDRMYLCGGMASLRGMDAYLNHALGVTVHTVNPFKHVLAKFNVSAFESVSHREAAFGGAMGLATDDLRDAPQGIGASVSDTAEFLWTRAG
jgi:type IV pilus assembly protein PilM